ncbi:unnamed protein product [Bursaphelenchus xylophilus]|uniref:Lipase n=1 Tax=Bursaphelenchus xylophilus TaxID=6326 RepID=A0A1I7SV58_BURXY|nr:unnamed protein product [Bursaphelenchus xylophilus]CAG9100933.1 unnamed protein product [Bursaphelenchus xylophilus]
MQIVYSVFRECVGNEWGVEKMGWPFFGGELDFGILEAQIAAFYGYPVETHKVQTDDGYLIDIHRIPSKKDTKIPNRYPLVMMHGLEVASDSWVLNGRNGSAGFYLADVGFDVWLANVRGNKYARKHVKLNILDRNFWDFSYDQMAEFDLPAIIDYVKLVTKRKSVYYIGYSQGALLMFAKLASDPGFAGNIKRFFAVAPVTRVQNLKGPMSSIGRFHNAFPFIWQANVPGEYLNDALILRPLSTLFCRSPITRHLCTQHIIDYTGPHWHLNESRIGVYTAHSNSGTSMMNMLHYYQSLETDEFQKYDFGEEGNLKKYGQKFPPIYDLASIRDLPLHIFSSPEDWLANEKDVDGYLLRRLRPEIVAEVTRLPNYGHIDFIWGMDAIKDIYRPIAERAKELDGAKLIIS